MNRIRVGILLQDKIPLVNEVRHRLHAVDMCSQMGGIVDPSLHGEHIDTIRTQHDMIDLLQAPDMGSDGQCDREIALLVLAVERTMRQLLQSLHHLRVKRVSRMRRLREQRRVTRICQRRQRVLAGDAIHMQTMRVLEGFDGVSSVRPGSAVDSEGVAVGVAVAEVVQFLLQIFCLIDGTTCWRRMRRVGMGR